MMFYCSPNLGSMPSGVRFVASIDSKMKVNQAMGRSTADTCNGGVGARLAKCIGTGGEPEAKGTTKIGSSIRRICVDKDL